MKSSNLISIMIIVFIVLISGCSYFSFTPMMCDRTDGQNIPQECYEYSDEDAQKASELTPTIECKDCSNKKDVDFE